MCYVYMPAMSSRLRAMWNVYTFVWFNEMCFNLRVARFRRAPPPKSDDDDDAKADCNGTS